MESEKPTKHEIREAKRREKEAAREAERKAAKKMNVTRKMATYGAVVLAVAAIGYFLMTSYKPAQSECSGIGALNSEHTHATWNMTVDGRDLVAERFSKQAYQLRARFVHMEGGDTILHKHATGVTFGCFLETLGVKLNSTCLVLDDGESFCTDPAKNKTLKFFVNGQENSLFNKYEVNFGMPIKFQDAPRDRIEVRYE